MKKLPYKSRTGQNISFQEKTNKMRLFCFHALDNRKKWPLSCRQFFYCLLHIAPCTQPELSYIHFQDFDNNQKNPHSRVLHGCISKSNYEIQ